MPIKRIAINCGGGYAPGLNGVLVGAGLAAKEQGWDVVGIHDGYDGLLAPEAYGDGGVLRFDARAIDALDIAGSALGTGARHDPFRMRHVGEDGFVSEQDRSEDVMASLRALGIDAVVSVVGGSALTGQHALNVAFKLSRKGLATICIPKSIENDIAATALAFGFNSALSYAVETLDRLRTAARDVRRLAVVEVPGHEAGWLALQAGLAARADAILIPQIPHDVARLAANLRERGAAGRRAALVVVAEGARSIPGSATGSSSGGLRKSLAPLSDPGWGDGTRVIERSGALADSLAAALQRSTDLETMPFALGQLVRGGAPTAVDRQLGLGYGAAAIQALAQGRAGVMVALRPPDLDCVPLGEAINRIRTVPAESEFIHVARALGVCLGD